MPDCTQPGQTTLTLTPRSAASARSESDSPTTACLVVEYGRLVGKGTRPARESGVYNMAIALPRHDRMGRLDAVDHPHQVDGNHLPPVSSRRSRASAVMAMPALLNR